MNLQEKIKFLRKSIRMSQRELAEELGLSQNIVSCYERGTRKPSYDVLMGIDMLAKKYKVKVQILRT